MAPFSEEEIKMAIFDMERNKAPGPDGFPAEFYQFFWEVVKPNLTSLFYQFHDGRVPIHSLNFRILTLLPKVTDAVRYSNIGQFAF
jgi:mannosylglycoprotein endo-beta-mannosidase